MHTAIAMSIHSLPIDFTELSHPAVDNKKTMCYITNRTKKIVSPGRKVGILSYSELCTCHFANVALKSYKKSVESDFFHGFFMLISVYFILKVAHSV